MVHDTCEEGDFIWIQDYHLMLLPSMLRALSPNAKLGFFLHVPSGPAKFRIFERGNVRVKFRAFQRGNGGEFSSFRVFEWFECWNGGTVGIRRFPSSELYRALPYREDILHGMLAADLLGFQTYDYARHFLSSCEIVLGIETSPDRLDTKSRRLLGAILEFETQGHDINSVLVSRDETRLCSSFENHPVLVSLWHLRVTFPRSEREPFATLLVCVSLKERENASPETCADFRLIFATRTPEIQASSTTGI